MVRRRVDGPERSDEPSVVDLAGDEAEPGNAPGPGWSATLPERSEDVVLVAGVGYDPGWRLTVDGADAGRPLLMNGYAAAWVVSSGESAALRLSYGPQ